MTLKEKNSDLQSIKKNFQGPRYRANVRIRAEKNAKINLSLRVLHLLLMYSQITVTFLEIMETEMLSRRYTTTVYKYTYRTYLATVAASEAV